MFAATKRSRDEVDDDFFQSPPECKKPRTLPFRTSPTTRHTVLFSSSRHVPKLPALTPAESSEDDSDIESGAPRHPKKVQIPSFFTSEEDVDMDMDIMDSQPMASPMWSPKSPSTEYLGISGPMASPAYPGLSPTGQSTANTSARIPTPIYGHFSTLQKPSQLSLNRNSPAAAKPSASGVVRPSAAEQHDAFIRRRRLPSPISEDENMNSPTFITKDLLKDLDMSATPSAVVFPDHDLMTPETPDFGPRKESCSSMGSAGSGGQRRRSDAISNCGEGSKVVFSMGFRADCDKCRERVPGHYSHVLRV